MSHTDLILNNKNKVIPLDRIHFSEANKVALDQLLREFKYVHILKEYDLPVDNKILLFGHTGCGKTTTAIAIADALDKKLVTLNLGGFVSSRLGETSKNMKSIFQRAQMENAVLLIDEFDYIGKLRDFDAKDSGEMKRLVNTVIQLIDNLQANTLLIAATNHASIIDTALLRRFQLKLKYEMPTEKQLDHYYDTMLKRYPIAYTVFERVYSISYAEAKDYIFRNLKNKIIEAEELKNK